MDRTEELQKLFEKKGWGAIRRIAEQYGIEKPTGGWDEAIPLIVEAENAIAPETPVETKKAEPAKVPEPKPETIEAKPAAKAPLKFNNRWYKANDITCCDVCGYPNPTDLEGNPICPVSAPTCPRMKN